MYKYRFNIFDNSVDIFKNGNIVKNIRFVYSEIEANKVFNEYVAKEELDLAAQAASGR